MKLGFGLLTRDRARGAARVALTLALPALLSACGGDESGDDDNGTPAGDIALVDANNYSSTSELTLDIVDTAPEVDLNICWPDLIDDIQCHDVDPLNDIDKVAMIRFARVDYAEATELLTAGELDMSQVDGYAQYDTDHVDTCASLSELTLLGSPFVIADNYFESDERLYLLMFGTGTDIGTGARSMMFIRPRSGVVNTDVEAPAGCGDLVFEANLQGLTPVEIPEAGPWAINWRDVTLDGLGNPIASGSIDRVLVAFYEGMTLAQIESQIFDIELIATKLWELGIGAGFRADLRNATLRGSGEPFPGFTGHGTGTWLFALQCTTCQNPSPVVLTVLEPVGG